MNSGDTTIELSLDETVEDHFGNGFDGQINNSGVIRAGFDHPGGILALAVTGYDIDYATEISVSLNGALIGSLSTGPNNDLNGGDYFSLPGENLRSGRNWIEFVQTGKPHYIWGVTQLRLEQVTVPQNELRLLPGEVVDQPFGNRFQGTSDADGEVAFGFSGTETDLELRLTGFDIDYATEVEVLLGSTSLGFLSQSPNNGLNGGDSFDIAKGLQGEENVITIRQNGKPSYVWGVTDIELIEKVAAQPELDFTLLPGSPETGFFGNRFAGRTDSDGIVRADFENTGIDLDLLIEGFDIDYATEVSVQLNGSVIGYLRTGANEDLNGGDVFRLDADVMLPGSNILTFEQTGKASYMWGITNIQLEPVEEPPPPSGEEPEGPKLEVYLFQDHLIADGDRDPMASKGTDYGPIDVTNTLLDAHYRLANRGDEPLAITGLKVSGPDAASFSLQPLALNPIPPSATAQLTVRFDPESTGRHDAIIEITSNDPDEAVFDFAIMGHGIVADGFSLGDLMPGAGLAGTDLNDDIRGTDRPELIDAGSGDDTQHGLNGDDFLIIGPGRDKNFGGGGLDVAVFDGPIGSFSGIAEAKDAYMIDDLEPSNGDLGFDRVKAVELFVFDDAIFDTRSGASEAFTDQSALAIRLSDLLATGDAIA